MTDLEVWRTGNAHYLSAAIAWLRLRLQRADPDITVTDQAMAIAEAQMLEKEAIEPPPALITLSSLFRLTRFERSLLILCAAMELDTGIASLCAQAQGGTLAYPTYALAFGLFDNSVWDVVSPERPLRFWRLIEPYQSEAHPLTMSPLRIDERIANYLKGLNYLDPRLKSLLAPLPIPETEESPYDSLAPSQQQVVETIAHQLQTSIHKHSQPIIQLLGSDHTSKQLVARSIADRCDLLLYRMRVELLPTHATELETLIRLWQREVHLFPVALYLDGQAMEGGESTHSSAAALRSFLDSAQGLFFLEVREQSIPLNPSTLSFDVAKPTPGEQWQAWQQVFGDAKADHGALLASQFNLNLTEIQEIADTALADFPSARKKTQPALQSTSTSISKSKGELLCDRLWSACLIRSRPRLDALAQRLDTKATWDDIVLSTEEQSMLRRITEQVRYRSTVYDEWGFRDRMNRGLGVNALFAGDSGTGKTMAAEVIANELRLDLYRIDLSAVVNKYIGETEKNLRRLFDAAEDGGAILFFDEADALFGKRSAVKDSHDRYANIEVNYLLQRIEAYRGLAILATNLKSSMDSAFMRRLRFVIHFPFPSLESRKQMWQKVFPPQTPVEMLDYDYLGRMNITGGSIHNIAINAAFLAAQEGASVGMSHILSAARAEFRKLERPIYEADFCWEAHAKED